MGGVRAGYKYLKTYKLAAIVYGLTVVFCERWVDRFSRTRDQMVQAARSGKQNIVEGSKGKSLRTYIRLCGVARASLEELLEDYHDFARQQGLRVWESREEREKLLNQANYLLDRQIKSLERKFVEEGGFTENLFRKRVEYRHKADYNRS